MTTNPSSASVSPQRLNQMAWGYAAPLMIEAALENELFTALDKGPYSAEELAKATGTSIRGVRSLANGLVGLDLLTKDSAGRYALGPEAATFLVPGKPAFQGGLYRHLTSQLLPKWMKLAQVVRTGKPAMAVNQQSDGSEFFHQFVEDIFPLSYPATKCLGAHLNLANATASISVLDLASGSGVWGIGLAQASQSVKVTAVDWPDVLPVTRRIANRFGLGERFTFVPGDLLAPSTDFGSGHQIATLGHILHSEGESRSRELLKKTASALASGGTIAIAEFTANDDRTGPPGSMIFAVNMLINTTDGDTFTFPEVRAWLQDAGFVDVRTFDAPGPAPLILATRA